MRKSFIFLLTIFVCAVGPVATSAQTELNSSSIVISQSPSNSGQPSELTALSAPNIVSQISEARRLLSSRQTDGRDLVTVAPFYPYTSQTSMFSLTQNDFLPDDSKLSSTVEPAL